MPLGEVVRLVVERDPGVRALGSERQAAASEAKRTETLRLPKLYLNTDVGAGKLVNDVSNVLLTGLSPASVTDPTTRSRLADLSSDRPFVVPGARLENRLFDGGRTRAAIRSAWLNESKAGVAEARTREDEAFTVASDFLDLAQSRVFSSHLEDYSRVAGLVAEALDDQVKAGRITEARALIGRAKLEDARTAVENNRDDLRLISNLLRGKAGLPDDAAFDTRSLESRLEEFSLSVMPEDSGLDKNATLQTALLDTRIQEQQVKAARGHRLPEIKFVAEYGFAFSSLLFTFRPGYNVGVRASYPLFTSREIQRTIQMESRRLDAAAFREAKTRAVLSEEYTRLLAENRKLGRQHESARSQLAQAEEVYRVAQLKYDQGAGSPDTLLEAAELLLGSRRRCLELTRSSLLLRWSTLRFQGKLLAALEREALP